MDRPSWLLWFYILSSPKIAGLSHDTMFGFKVPFNIHTCNPCFLCTILDSQLTNLTRCCSYDRWITSHIHTLIFPQPKLSHRQDRAWDQIAVSRGKGLHFWQSYIEEWEYPPHLDLDSKKHKFIEKWLGSWFGLFLIKRGMLHIILAFRFWRFGLVLLSPFQVYPFVGIAVSAWFKALGTSHFLQRWVSKSRTLKSPL